MFKKSIARIENESSQSELSNPALHDIIATNHVIYPKKSHEERLSRACKALLIMIILVLVAIGIIILTLVLAHSRNTLMAIVSRSAQENSYSTSNRSRLLVLNQLNSTMANEQTEIENSSQTTTVTLTSDNLPTLTSSNVHISTSNLMTTKQQYEYISSTMKPYPSSNTISNKPSTISTNTNTMSQTTTYISSSDVIESTITSRQDDIETSTEQFLLTSTEHSLLSKSILGHEQTTAMFDESSFSSFIREHFNVQTSTVTIPKVEKQEQKKFAKKLIEEDIMDDILF